MSGIFCIETVWDTDEFVSVKEPLKFVARYNYAKFKHRIAKSPTQFNKLVAEWNDRDDWEYPILCLGFHGFTKGIVLSESKTKTLWNNVRFDQLADFSEGTWKNCLIHFASCSTMDAGDGEFGTFLERTRLEAISGYATDVDWAQSMAFEFLYFSQLLGQIKDRYLWAETMKICRDWAENDSSSNGLAKALQFKIAVQGD